MGIKIRNPRAIAIKFISMIESLLDNFSINIELVSAPMRAPMGVQPLRSPLTTSGLISVSIL